MDSYITKVSLCIGMISNPYIKHIVNKNIKDTDKIYKNIWKISLSYFYLLICKNTEEGWNNEIMTTTQIFLPHIFIQWWYKDSRSSDKVANFSSGSAIIYGCMNIIFFSFKVFLYKFYAEFKSRIRTKKFVYFYICHFNFQCLFWFYYRVFYIFKHFYMVKMSLQTKEYSCKFSYKGIVKKIQLG